MEWVRERDLLIAQTLAFVQSVSGKQSDAGLGLKPRTESALVDAIRSVAPPDNVQISNAQASNTQASNVQISNVQVSIEALSIQVARPSISSDFRNEIRTRVASFRAHQERFNREREEYCRATLAKARAGIGDASAPALPPK
jgi:hypothetical protein